MNTWLVFFLLFLFFGIILSVILAISTRPTVEHCFNECKSKATTQLRKKSQAEQQQQQQQKTVTANHPCTIQPKHKWDIKQILNENVPTIAFVLENAWRNENMKKVHSHAHHVTVTAPVANLNSTTKTVVGKKYTHIHTQTVHGFRNGRGSGNMLWKWKAHQRVNRSKPLCDWTFFCCFAAAAVSQAYTTLPRCIYAAFCFDSSNRHCTFIVEWDFALQKLSLRAMDTLCQSGMLSGRMVLLECYSFSTGLLVFARFVEF